MTDEMGMARDLGLILPEIIVVLTAIAALSAGMLRRHALALPLTLVGLLMATALTVPLIGDNTVTFSGTYRVDTLSVWSKLILLPATGLTAILAHGEVRGTDREATVYSLLTFATVGALALSGAGDVMFLVLGVLLTSLATFGLVAYPRTDMATEAAMKFFVFGAVSGSVMIFGLTFWFGATGSTLIADLDRLSTMRLAAVAGLVGVLVGLGYKAGLTPFHFWVPDAYDGAPLAVAAYLSVVPKIGAVFALADVARNLPPDVANWRIGVAGLAIASMLYGNLAALPQTNVVRLLAYSSIAQSGYLIFGIVAIERTGLAISSLVVFAAAYAAMNIGMFSVIALVGRDLQAFAGVGRGHPWLGGATVIFLLSLVGIPPLGGFIGKLLLFGAVIDARFTWLAVVGILNSVLSLAVYLRIIVPMYQAPRKTPARGRLATAVLVTTVILTVGIGLAAQVITDRIA